MNNVKLAPLLLVFAEVASLKSFTLAAQRLGMSKAAVSQQVKRLEAELGMQLLSRHTRGMSLTLAGEKLLSRSELLRDQIDIAFDELDQVRDMPSGEFALTLPHSLEVDIVYPALSQLCIEFPLIEPRLLVTDEPVDLIQENLDVALYGGEPKDSNYRALPIGTISEVFCASPAYVRKHGMPTMPDDLQQHRWIPTRWQTPPLPIYKNTDLKTRMLLAVEPFGGSNTMSSTVQMVMYDMVVAF